RDIIFRWSRGQSNVVEMPLIVLSIKIVVWIAVVKLSTSLDRWSFWLGLAVAVLFTVFESVGSRWGLLQAMMFGADWCIAAFTLWAFGRSESMLARFLIMATGSFLLILGPFLIPVPLG